MINVAFTLEHQQSAPVTSCTTTTMDNGDRDHDDADIDQDEELSTSSISSTKYMQQHYQSLLNCVFQERPITRRHCDYDIEDPTVHVRQRLTLFCKELVEAVNIRFKDTPSIFLLMKNCLDVSSLYEQVVLSGQQTLADYGHSSLQQLLDFTIVNSKYIKINSTAIQQQYGEWKQRCLSEITDKETFNIWTTNGKIITTKVMKTFYTDKTLANDIHEFLYFYSLMILRVRSEAICESACSILKGHIHNNRSLQHSSLDKEAMLHWNAIPIHLADLFIRSSLNDYFSQTKEKQWLFYKNSEQYQVWKLVSPDSAVLNHLRKIQVERLPEQSDIR